MEKLHEVPQLDNYYRDDRGGLEFYLDALFPHPETNFITSKIDKVGCELCKTTTAAARFVLGNKVTAFMLQEFVEFVCHFAIPYIGYVPSTCPGIIKQQFSESIYPIIVNNLLGEQYLCVFTLGICEKGDWEAQDLKEEIFDMLNSKPQNAKTNDFVNKLYKEHKD